MEEDQQPQLRVEVIAVEDLELPTQVEEDLVQFLLITQIKWALAEVADLVL